MILNTIMQTYQVSFEQKIIHFQVYSSWKLFLENNLKLYTGPPNLWVRGECLVATQFFPGFISFFHDIY